MGKNSVVIDENLQCDCGGDVVTIGHYISGVPTNFQYFTRCENCRKRTLDRKTRNGALTDWNNKRGVI